MKTALDRDVSQFDFQEQKFIDNIKRDGWAATHVLADGENVEFSYTTGFWFKFQFPELIVFSLSHDVAHQIFWNMANVLTAGETLPINSSTLEAIEGYEVFLKPASPLLFYEYLTWTRWFYDNGAFQVQQLVWPDMQGNFPWQAEAEDNFKLLQPNLTNRAW